MCTMLKQTPRSRQGLLLAALSALLVAACQDAGVAAPPMPTPEVTVATPAKRQITDWDEYIGRFQAIERVEVRARVSGYLESINFDDGQIVSEGDVLFVVDPRPFKIDLDRARAQYELAVKEYARAVDLRKKRAIAQEVLDRRAQERSVTKAALDEAELNLEFTEVKSPINGRVSRSAVDVGNLITGGSADASLLTTVVSLDPIHFYFQGSESDLLRYIRLDRAGERPRSSTNANPLHVRLQDEDNYDHRGHMDFVDNELDASTGTIEGRAIIPNPDGVLYPGLFGRARLLGSGQYEALLVPDEVIGTDQSRRFVMVVGAENTAEMRFIEPGTLQDDGLRVVRQGLSENDRVVINGLQRARPGMAVVPVEGEIRGAAQSESVAGVTTEAAPAATGVEAAEAAQPSQAAVTSEAASMPEAAAQPQ